VRPEDVEFDPEAVIGPVRVDLVAGDETVHRRRRQPALPHDLQEPSLEIGAGEDRRLVVDLQRRPDLGLAPMPFRTREQVFHRPGEIGRRQTGRVSHERPLGVPRSATGDVQGPRPRLE
jgi:hypothetical protein